MDDCWYEEDEEHELVLLWCDGGFQREMMFDDCGYVFGINQEEEEKKRDVVVLIAGKY
jgi:hypothetical protein